MYEIFLNPYKYYTTKYTFFLLKVENNTPLYSDISNLRNYSTTGAETVIGTFNGKILYRTVIKGKLTGPTNAWETVCIIKGVEEVINMHFIFKRAGSDTSDYQNVTAEYMYDIEGIQCYVLNPKFLHAGYTGIIEYTKTTE